MPNKQFIWFEVEGLCLGGNGVSVTNKGVGCILFIQGVSGNDAEQFNLYRDRIALPFINKSREIYFLDPIRDHMRAVMFSYGDMSEVASTHSNNEIWDDNNIVR